MLDIAIGSLGLFLGWLCFHHVSRLRALYSKEHTSHSRFYGEKPLMIFPFALGVLFVLDGLALLALAAYGLLQGVGGSENIVNIEMMLIVALVSITAMALIRIIIYSRRNKRKVERPQATVERARIPSSQASKSRHGLPT